MFPSLIVQGHRVEQRPCPSVAPCPTSASEPDANPNSVYDRLEIERYGAIWRPLFSSHTISPCSCGCIYIVGGRRRVRVTSGEECSATEGPLRWKVKVRTI